MEGLSRHAGWLVQVHGLRVLTQLAALDLSHNKLLSLEPTSLPGSLRFLQVLEHHKHATHVRSMHGGSTQG